MNQQDFDTLLAQIQQYMLRADELLAKVTARHRVETDPAIKQELGRVMLRALQITNRQKQLVQTLTTLQELHELDQLTSDLLALLFPVQQYLQP